MGETAPSGVARFSQAERRGGEAFDIWAIETSIPSGATLTTSVVEFDVTSGLVGVLRAIGMETTAAGWAAITWQIQVGGRPARNYGAQIRRRWGFLHGPGDVYVPAFKNQVIRLVATQASGAAILASGRLLGSTWHPT